jgi:hypothetical protein
MEKQEQSKTQKPLYTYKGRHLVRKDREIYYGNMSDEYVTKIDVQSFKRVESASGKALDVPDKLRIQLLPTDTENLDITKIKTTSRESLYDALDVAHNWLVKAN